MIYLVKVRKRRGSEIANTRSIPATTPGTISDPDALTVVLESESLKSAAWDDILSQVRRMRVEIPCLNF